jgi:hypothetical protein
MKKNQQISTKTALINLYLHLKNYSSNKKNQKKEEDIEHLSSLTEINIIKYIKDSIDAIVQHMAEKKINDYNSQFTNENIQQDYEAMLVKYEKDIRGHIKTEHQLKLYADSLQNNIEDLEKGKTDQTTNNNYREIIYEKNNIINELKKENGYNKKLMKSYEEQNIKLSDNEKKFKNLILKIEKKYKNEIEILNKKVKYYMDKLDNINIEKDEKGKKNETIYCNSSRHPINQNLMNNYLENDNSNNHNINRIYRNVSNSISISNNHSTSLVNSRPYEKIEKFLLSKYQKNSNKDQYQNKIKNLKNSSANHSKDKNIRNGNNNISNNSYIIDSKLQDELMNKFMINDSSLNNTMKKNKKVYHRHKSIENEKFVKGKQMNIIKKILMSNNNNNASNTLRNSCKAINKGIYNNNNELINKKITSSNNNSTINNSKNYINNKASKDMNINNIIGSKNNIGCNFVNNINIYSNNLKQDNNSNMYITNNLKKYSGNSSVRELINNDGLHNSNYINIHGNANKNNYINYRNKQKEGKMVSSLTNSLQKKF